MGDISFTEEQIKALRPHLEAAGIDPGVQGEEKPEAPMGITVDIGQQLRRLGQELGSICATHGLYRFRDMYVTVDEKDRANSMPEMEPERFISWVQGFAVTERYNVKKDGYQDADMTRQLAVNVMKSDTFREQIPKIKVVLPTCLPVMSDEAEPELLRRGYNAKEEIYVLKSAPVLNDELTLHDAVKRFGEIFGEFPWGDDGRSMAAHVACSLGMFCQYMFPDACAVPLFQYTANLEGAGKSLLCRSALIPIYTLSGLGSTDYAENDKFKDELNSIALSNKGYLFLDDVVGSLFNPVLNRWVTESTWEFRKFHSQTQIRVDKRCMTFISDNGCTLSDDLIRRTVIVSLQMEERASDRESKLKSYMSEQWLNKDDNRAELLSIWWAMVKNWSEKGMKNGKRSIPSFRDWTLKIGGMVEAAGFNDPFAPANLLDGGDKRRTEIDLLLQKLVEDFKPDPIVDLPLSELCACARENGLFEYPLGDLSLVRVEMDGNPAKFYDYQDLSDLKEADRNYQAARWMNPQKMASPFSKRLKKHLARKFKVGEKYYRLVKRDARVATYQLMLADEE